MKTVIHKTCQDIEIEQFCWRLQVKTTSTLRRRFNFHFGSIPWGSLGLSTFFSTSIGTPKLRYEKWGIEHTESLLFFIRKHCLRTMNIHTKLLLNGLPWHSVQIIMVPRGWITSDSKTHQFVLLDWDRETSISELISLTFGFRLGCFSSARLGDRNRLLALRVIQSPLQCPCSVARARGCITLCPGTKPILTVS